MDARQVPLPYFPFQAGISSDHAVREPQAEAGWNASFFMSVIKISRETNITFTEAEMDSILEVLKEHSSPDELNRMNQIMQMRKSMG